MPRTPSRLDDLAAARVAIENVMPTIDGGAFPAKTVAGRPVRVEADLVCDGHDKIAGAVLHRPAGTKAWTETPLGFVDNDRWAATVAFEGVGSHEMQVIAWRDPFATFADEIAKKQAAGVSITLELEEGARLFDRAKGSDRLAKGDKPLLTKLARTLRGKDEAKAFAAAVEPETIALMARIGPRDQRSATPVYPVRADRELAAFSAWYELFPRSMKLDGVTHGTFRDVIDRLPYVTDLGFDVLYFPPIHPIGRTNRKGRNNTLTPEPHDVGVPYAIGSSEGGHLDVHPELGTLADFDALVAAAGDAGLEIALDIALNASPDHPWIAEHPDWFEWRPDGTIRYAENPPKKYEDIVNFSFYEPGTDTPVTALWEAMRDMFLHWAAHGVTIFRVDNPHTKPLPFWQWLIEEVHAEHPGAIFLAEAFTKPKVMRRLAKIGFNQSYSYFTWRNAKHELVEYMRELTGQVSDRGGLGGAEMPWNYRPNFFVNTPDINPHYLQEGGRAAHRVRAVLAATLAGNWGVYNGFEICDARPLPKPDGSGTKEEYLDSEKYQLRAWDMDGAGPHGEGHIKDDIRLLNRLRREHPALQQFANLAFYPAHDEHVIHYGKWSHDRSSFVLVSVNLDPHAAHGAAMEVPLWAFGLSNDATIQATDLVTGDDFTWTGIYQHVHLTPDDRPYAIWELHAPGKVRAPREPSEAGKQGREAERQQMAAEGGRA